jgi:hypothetical protein
MAGQLHTSAALPPGQDSSLLTEWETVQMQSQFLRVEKGNIYSGHRTGSDDKTVA